MAYNYYVGSDGKKYSLDLSTGKYYDESGQVAFNGGNPPSNFLKPTNTAGTGTTATGGTTGGGSQPSTSPGSVDVQPGLTAAQWAATFGEQVAARKAQDEIERQRIAAQQSIAALQASATTQAASINAAAQAASDAANSELQLKLQQGKITSDQYMQAKELAQRENEFVRDLALRTTAEAHNYEIQKAQTELDRLTELRNERALQAQLAANPEDTVAYEFYKRSLGQALPYDLAKQYASGKSGGSTQQGIGSTQAAQVAAGTQPENMLGQPYEKAPGAYADQSLQDLLSGITQNAGANQPLYNPNMKGTGVFGSQIVAPNEISRAQYQNMDQTDLGVLTSFLKAGVQMGPNGERVALKPEDYFNQMKASFIPTLDATMAAYS